MGGSNLNWAGTLEERFWRFVAKGEPDACWLWTGAKNGDGYGTIGRGGVTARGTAKMTTAHRLSFELHYGPIPAGMVVCHRCDVRNCVNPAHLFVGTQRDNVRDAIAKGRHRICEGGARGERNGAAKLREVDIPIIRWLTQVQGISHTTVAACFGVARSTVASAVKGKTWSGGDLP